MKKRLAKKIFYGKSPLSYNKRYTINAGIRLFSNRNLFALPWREPRDKAIKRVLRKFRKNRSPEYKKYIAWLMGRTGRYPSN